MALGNALHFVKMALGDEDFRHTCYKFESKNELMSVMGFSEPELEDAVNMHLVKCQTYEDAEKVHQIQCWFTFL